MERTDLVNGDIKLTQNTDGLCYGTDALLLSAFVSARRGGRAAELGAGTGIISILCAKRGKFGQITAVELQPEYASLCERNVADNGMQDVIHVLCADVRDIDGTQVGAELDAVFANPPYLSAGSGPRNENDGKYAARHEVNGGIYDFCACAARLLRHGGSAYYVFRPDRLCDLLSAMRNTGTEPKRLTVVYSDRTHAPCLVLAEGRKGGKAGITVTRPLFVKENGEDSPAVKYIYERGEMPNGYGYGKK